MDIRWDMYLTMEKVCKEKKVDLETFKVNARASPSKKDPTILKKIREDFRNFVSSFFAGIPFSKYENNGNSKKYSKEKMDKMAKNTRICFRGAFREFLQDIKRRYSDTEDVWKIKNCLKNK